MGISAEAVKRLRDETNAPMMDCKKALSEANGDYEKAKVLLRERGLATLEKRMGKAANEGTISIYLSDDKKLGAILELNCETDFVAKTDDFQSLAAGLAQAAAQLNPSSVDELMQLSGPSGHSWTEELKERVSKLGEKISVKRFQRFATDGGALYQYIHTGGKIGVIVETAGSASEEVGRGVAMQISWSQPTYIDRDDVPADVIAREREIQVNLARNEGRPEAALEKIVEGRMAKQFFETQCLLEQHYIKDESLKIKDLIDQQAPGMVVRGFVRYRVGEDAAGN
jgi:elongation factor Ts